LRNIEAEKEIEQIKKNIRKLKEKLKEKSSSFAIEIYKYLDSVELDNLKWQNPLASQVITDEFVQTLSKKSGDENVYKSFKEPLN
ncbi:5313_t:CDS:2, partial [Racocetra fulgida]